MESQKLDITEGIFTSSLHLKLLLSVGGLHCCGMFEQDHSSHVDERDSVKGSSEPRAHQSLPRESWQHHERSGRVLAFCGRQGWGVWEAPGPRLCSGPGRWGLALTTSISFAQPLVKLSGEGIGTSLARRGAGTAFEG